jgi:hypothetical protein
MADSPNYQAQLAQLKQNQINGWDIKDPETQRLNEMQRQSIAQQQQMLNAQQGNIASNSNFTPQDNLAPLLGLTDQWTGSNFAKGYKAPESGADRLNKVQALESGLSSAQNVLTDNQLNQLKAALSEKKSDKLTQQAYLIHLENMQNQQDLLANKQDGKVDKDKVIPASIATELADYRNLYGKMDRNWTDWTNLASSQGSLLASINPNSDAGIYKNKQSKLGTEYSRVVLHGRGTKEMGELHASYLPSVSNDKNAAMLKAQGTKEDVLGRYNDRLTELAQAGYNMSDIPKIQPTELPGEGTQMPSRDEMLKALRGN